MQEISYTPPSLQYRKYPIHCPMTYSVSVGNVLHSHLTYSVSVSTVLPRCYALLAVTPPPPPYFREKLLYRVILPQLHAPPRAARAGLRYFSSCTCTRVASVDELYLCIKRVENSLRTGLGHFADLGRFPEAVILPSRPVGGVWLRDYLLYVLQHVRGPQLFHPSVLPRHVDRRSSRLLPHYRVRKFVGGGGGGLTARRKRKSSLLPPPLFFLKAGRKKGGRNSGAVR